MCTVLTMPCFLTLPWAYAPCEVHLSLCATDALPPQHVSARTARNSTMRKFAKKKHKIYLLIEKTSKN